VNRTGTSRGLICNWHFHKVFQDRLAKHVALLWVKLYAYYQIPLNRCDEGPPAVLRLQQCVLGMFQDGVVGVDEIKTRGIRQVRQHRRSLRRDYTTPTHVWDREPRCIRLEGETHTAKRNNA